jgi:hypothetical protein
MRCEKWGEEMILWKVWTPTHGVLYYLPDDAPKWVETGTSSRDVAQAQLKFSFHVQMDGSQGGLGLADRSRDP